MLQAPPKSLSLASSHAHAKTCPMEGRRTTQVHFYTVYVSEYVICFVECDHTRILCDHMRWDFSCDHTLISCDHTRISYDHTRQNGPKMSNVSGWGMKNSRKWPRVITRDGTLCVITLVSLVITLDKTGQKCLTCQDEEWKNHENDHTRRNWAILV